MRTSRGAHLIEYVSCAGGGGSKGRGWGRDRVCMRIMLNVVYAARTRSAQQMGQSCEYRKRAQHNWRVRCDERHTRAAHAFARNPNRWNTILFKGERGGDQILKSAPTPGGDGPPADAHLDSFIRSARMAWTVIMPENTELCA